MKKQFLIGLLSVAIVMTASSVKASFTGGGEEERKQQVASFLSESRLAQENVLDNQGASDEEKAKAQFDLALLDLNSVGLEAPAYDRARERFSSLLAEGHLTPSLAVRTHFFLGTMDHLGQGLDKSNFIDARNHFTAALEFESLLKPLKSHIYCSLARMDYFGEGIDDGPDYLNAYENFEIALEIGCLSKITGAKAYYIFGCMNYEGEGLDSPNYSKASEALKKATKSGCLSSQLQNKAVLMLKAMTEAIACDIGR